jgi:hypothetical protein
MFDEIVKMINDEEKIYKAKHFLNACRNSVSSITKNKDIKKMYYNGHLVETVDERGKTKFVFAPDVEACMLYSISTITRISQGLMNQV